MDPYKILNLPRNATLEEVQRAYRDQAAKHHPDNGGDAWAFQLVHEAYKELLEACESKGQGAGPPTQSASHRSSFHRKESTDASRDSQAHRATENEASEHAEPKSGNFFQGTRDKLWHLAFGQLPLQNETTSFILVNVLDIFMTYILLRFGGIEANPVARLFLRRWDFDGMIAFKMVMVAFVAILAQVIARYNPRRAKQLLLLGTVIVGCVVVHGILLFVRHYGS